MMKRIITLPAARESFETPTKFRHQRERFTLIREAKKKMLLELTSGMINVGDYAITMIKIE